MDKYFKIRHFLKNRNEMNSEKDLEKITAEINEESRVKLQNVIENTTDKEIIFLCIGTDLFVVDSLGPLVGTMLVEHGVPFQVYGTLRYPIHAENLKASLNEIKKKVKNPLIIAVDACIGDKNQIGSIFFENGPLFPGLSLYKCLPAVGDYQIKAVVSYQNLYNPSHFFHDTRLYTVMNIAKAVVKMVLDSTKEIDFEECEHPND